MDTRNRQLIVRRRMSLAGNTAVDLAVIRCCRAVVVDTAALETARLQHECVRRRRIIIRDQTELVRIGRIRSPLRRIVRELQRIGGVAALQESNALDSVLRREVVRRQPRAIDSDLVHVNARAREVARIRDRQHRIAERSRTVQLELVVLEVVDGIYCDIPRIDVQRIARRRLIAAVDVAVCERCSREIRMCVIAEIDRVVLRLAVRMPRICAINTLCECPTCNGNYIVLNCISALSSPTKNKLVDCSPRDNNLITRYCTVLPRESAKYMPL